MRILVLGGYGNFGARICRALSADGDIELIAAGRDPNVGHRRAAFDSRIGKAQLDISDSGFIINLSKLAPNIIIHCVGPFQGQDYRVALASIAAGAHYIDLADGRSFVNGFEANVNAKAQAAGLLAVTGASTLPALSSAVLDSLTGRFVSMEDIQISIAPAQRSPRGVATLKAVFSYLGKPFEWMEAGSWRIAYGWLELRRFQFAGLGRRWAAACDVPDLELLPSRYPSVKTLQFRAALEFPIEHFLLAGLAELHRLGIPIRFERYAAQIDHAASWLDSFGRKSGGMLVSVTGIGHEGRTTRVVWHLMANYDHGPEIPCMAAILLANKLARGQVTLRGAMPCVGLLGLADFETQFAQWGIETHIEDVVL